METTLQNGLSRRERQIMDIIYRLGQATAAEVQVQLPDPPSYSAVRAMLSVLERKHFLQHLQQGPRYLYTPTVAPDQAKHSALQNVLNTFFSGSAAQAVATLLDMSREALSGEELDRLSSMIEHAKGEGR
ncbi:MAG TPA: BlaI/MecI/CopY family transcriptional regulator [Candidatus Bipolaricaulota bacterium]